MAGKKPTASYGLMQLLSEDPSQMLLWDVEQAAGRANEHQLGRVLNKIQRRPERIGWFHASEIANPKSCPRYLAARVLGYHFRDDIGIKLQRIFDTGTYMHLRWQNAFLSLPQRFHADVAIVLEEWPILGEADALVDHPEMGRMIVELKSIREDGFKSLKKNPQDAHIRQVSMYVGLDEGMGHSSTGQVWYENKNNQDVKTFFFKRKNKRIYKDARERALEVISFVERGVLPPVCLDDCEYDERVGNMEWDENKWSVLREEIRAHAA